ncbi:hypothetical protein [Bartonella phoceensis]|nr:hypothetical protein [Bartonella phoceensis]
MVYENLYFSNVAVLVDKYIDGVDFSSTDEAVDDIFIEIRNSGIER